MISRLPPKLPPSGGLQKRALGGVEARGVTIQWPGAFFRPWPIGGAHARCVDPGRGEAQNCEISKSRGPSPQAKACWDGRDAGVCRKMM